jgi:hypothetical protein
VSYFNMSANDERIARAARSRPVRSMAEIQRAIAAMPARTELERRDQAVVAFAIVS